MISNFADPLKENGVLKSQLEELPSLTVVIIIVIVILQYIFFLIYSSFSFAKFSPDVHLADFGPSLSADWVVSVKT